MKTAMVGIKQLIRYSLINEVHIFIDDLTFKLTLEIIIGLINFRYI